MTCGEPQAPHTLQVVFKVVERCNINCSYCYYFNFGNSSAHTRPAIASIDTARELSKFLRQGIADLGIKRVLISFHGGEPLMMKPERLASICDIFSSELTSIAPVGFNVQTNGTIISDGWLRVFREYRVNVGVSIDGSQTAHDRFRVDFRERSTFARTERNLKRLVEWAGDDVGLVPSTISVMDWRNDYAEIYKYLRRTGIRQMSFLLPDRSFDSEFSHGESASSYGLAMADIFNAWLVENDPTVSVRQISSALKHFVLHDNSASRADSGRVDHSTQVIVAHSDGMIAVDDSYMPALRFFDSTPKDFCTNTTLRQFLSHPFFSDIREVRRLLAPKCQACLWRGLCGGGDLENRYSEENGFSNPSVYCEGLQLYFRNLVGSLLGIGYPAEELAQRLNAASIT